MIFLCVRRGMGKFTFTLKFITSSVLISSLGRFLHCCCCFWGQRAISSIGLRFSMRVCCQSLVSLLSEQQLAIGLKNGECVNVFV